MHFLILVVRSVGTAQGLMNIRSFPVVEESDRVCESITKYSVSNSQIVKPSTSLHNSILKIII